LQLGSLTGVNRLILMLRMRGELVIQDEEHLHERSHTRGLKHSPVHEGMLVRISDDRGDYVDAVGIGYCV